MALRPCAPQQRFARARTLPVALLLRVIMLVLLLVIRPARAAGARSLAVRLRELDEAYRAGLMSDDERVRQRARILDDA